MHFVEKNKSHRIQILCKMNIYCLVDFLAILTVKGMQKN
jgi:hypothetical protein